MESPTTANPLSVIPDGTDTISSGPKSGEVKRKSTFSSPLGSFVTCLGSAVGTGNIWRFPRIAASNSYSKGALTFYIAWALMLYLWSVPIIVVEYALGRFTKNSPLVAYCKFLGKYFVWIAGWIVGVLCLISCYYPVIVGWCLYYFYKCCAVAELPSTEEQGLQMFDELAENPYLTVLFQLIAVGLTGLCLFGGLNLIEKVNLVLVPLLLAILIFTFGWSMTRDYAEVAIDFLFTPVWSSFKHPSLWIAAASQNAFDTGAGLAALFTYAARWQDEQGIVRQSLFIPLANNFVSLYASFTIFATVFSILITTDGTITRSAILELMQETGPGSTGLTFTWIPVLFSKVGMLGRVLCALFFLSLSFAGISSLLALLHVPVLCLREIGVNNRNAVFICMLGCLVMGIPSAIILQFMDNQDNTWGAALIISGLCLALVPVIYGPNRFRRVIINDYGMDDWKVPIIWVPIIAVLVPGQSLLLIIWWFYQYIIANPNWYHPTYNSLMTLLMQWLILLAVTIGVNMIAIWWKKDLFLRAQTVGENPFDLSNRDKLEPTEPHTENAIANNVKTFEYSV